MAEAHKNRIGAFHPHDGVIIDFHLLKTLPEAHIRNGTSRDRRVCAILRVSQLGCPLLLPASARPPPPKHCHLLPGIAELTKISTVEQKECFELLEKHTEDLIKYKFGYADDAPAGLREIGRQIARKAVLRMLELECPNLLEHDQHRAIACPDGGTSEGLRRL